MSNGRVLTPGGYKRASNVHLIPLDHILVVRNDRYELHHRESGSVRDLGPVTRHTKGRPLHELLRAARGQLPEPMIGVAPTSNAAASGDADANFAVNGWSSYATWLNGSTSPIARMASTWTVPPEPQNAGDQLVYIFNGMENESMILQPVLQWGASPAGGGKKWSIANWYADSTEGHSFYSLLVDVQPGQELTGVMTMTSGADGKFSYTSSFDIAPSITLEIHGVDELNYAAQTIEAYGISSAADMPAAADILISDIQVHTVQDTAVVTWLPGLGYPHSGPVTLDSNTGNGGALRLGFWKS